MANKEQKTKRNQELRRYAKEHPIATLIEIGEIFGVKQRQGVWRILHPVAYNAQRRAKQAEKRNAIVISARII